MRTDFFTIEPGCGIATGRDRLKSTGMRSDGHEMQLNLTRSMMRAKTFQWSAYIDAHCHSQGSARDESDMLESALLTIWEMADKLPYIPGTMHEPRSNY